MKILGTNALVYIDGAVEAPQRNSWTLNVTRELHEARVFSDTGAGDSWVENTGGFSSWSGSLAGYYDTTDETMVETSIGTGRGKSYMTLYETRSTLTKYWYGVAWFDISQDTNVDGFIEVNADFTGDGQLYRFPAV